MDETDVEADDGQEAGLEIDEIDQNQEKGEITNIVIPEKSINTTAIKRYMERPKSGSFPKIDEESALIEDLGMQVETFN